jgi:hypothetical protein
LSFCSPIVVGISTFVILLSFTVAELPLRNITRASLGRLGVAHRTSVATRPSSRCTQERDAAKAIISPSEKKDIGIAFGRS